MAARERGGFCSLQETIATAAAANAKFYFHCFHVNPLAAQSG
jgi:hypothetical protein